MSRLSLSWTWHQLPHVITPALEYAPMGTFRAVRLHLFVGMLSLTIGPKPAPAGDLPEPGRSLTDQELDTVRARLRERLTRKDHQQ